MQIQQTSLDRFEVTEKPPFPLPGSVLGKDRRYFCLSPLGKGTFCGIHKCVDLSYSHSLNHSTGGSTEETGTKPQTIPGRFVQPKVRLVAAKVELSNFTNSGVIDSEAMILSYLSHCMENPAVPKFVEYIKNTNVIDSVQISSNGDTSSGGKMSAIIMEYLAGEDMHTIRDQHCQSVMALANSVVSPAQDSLVSPSFKKSSQSSLTSGRRLSVPDAIFLCADVFLPMIQTIHNMGIIHRDIKPSNCVRVKGTAEFRLIDFGLSKSFIVSEDSQAADQSKPWHFPRWMGSYFNYKKLLIKQKQMNLPASNTDELEMPSRGCISKERPKADFRGTSMYASLRVHQDRDYGRRDDLWSLMYVFCDFVAGGLPWMYFAAARDRKMCLAVKEWIHGERVSWEEEIDRNIKEQSSLSAGTPYPDHLDELLKGADYHSRKFKREEITVKTGDECTKTKTDDEGPNMKTDGESDMKMDNGSIALVRVDEKANHKSELVEIISKANGKDTTANMNGEGLQSLTEHNGKNNNGDDPDFLVTLNDDGSSNRIPDATPLPLALDPHKVGCLRAIFHHLSQLGYADEPDYSFIRMTLKKFGDYVEEPQSHLNESYPVIQWEKIVNTEKQTGVHGHAKTHLDSSTDPDDIESFEDIIRNHVGAKIDNLNVDSEKYTQNFSSEAEDLNRLPLALQLRLAQVEYNACNPSSIPTHIALRDWLGLAISLLHDPWDVTNYERKRHRDSDTLYRREVYLKLLTQCRAAARPFDNFIFPDSFYFIDENKNLKDVHEPKRRKPLNNRFASSEASNSAEAVGSMEIFHKTFRLLQEAIASEYLKETVPHSTLSFLS